MSSHSSDPGTRPPITAPLSIRAGGLRADLCIQGAVFDCDGLLMDSEDTWLRMLSSWLSEHGRTPEEAERFHGFASADTAERLGELTGLPAQSTLQEINARYSEMLSDGVELMPGARRLLTELAASVPTAVASNGLRRDVRTMLDSAGLLRSPGAVCTVEDVAAGKPAPDLYLEACERLGVDPAATAAFEDSPAGAQAAAAAGLIVIGVNQDPHLELPCRYRISSLEEVLLPTAEPEAPIDDQEHHD
ncbi:HAD family phosphatase [Nesterenkonia sp. NBAIMH1]|uniref:HAD family hydrolase n=1 Tax=Nesterenkonia sp. NBAIMH1 TaxID=2600320 RepID=UPI0011B70525|nr:HAD family phosphatase [Nesterenkonia sp. NBAIMH1]